MSFEQRSHCAQVCRRCGDPIPTSDLWFDKLMRCKHNALQSVSVKYDCRTCRHYQPWYDLQHTDSERCLDCVALHMHHQCVEAASVKPDLWESWERHGAVFCNQRYHTARTWAEQRRAKNPSVDISINDLTMSLELHVESLQCSGHWLYIRWDSTKCTTCRKEKNDDWSHCCCHSLPLRIHDEPARVV